MTQPNPEFERIRGYLQAQAAKLSVAEIVDKLRADTPPLLEAARSVPAAKFTVKPASDDWSAAEVLTHVLAMNEQGASAIEGIISTGAVPPRITDQIDGPARADLAGAQDYIRVWEERREAFYPRVLAAKGNEHLDVMMGHPMFGKLNWREWLLFMRVHDLDHMRQLQAITAHFAEEA